MKKLMLFFTIFCICFTVNVYAEEETVIRVGLYYGSSALDSVEINVDGEITTYTPSDIDGQVDIVPEEFVKVNTYQYRGEIRLIKNPEGKINVINVVDIEDYLASVISKEMSPYFEEEALKAQAVASRTYAMAHLNKHKNDGFDVCQNIHCQVYGGVSMENPKTTKAVDDTKGQVIKYDGELISAVYSASSGGYTESAVNVWGSDIPYLQAVSDEYEEEDVFGHKWTYELTVSKATEIMENKGYEIGVVTDIVINETTERGVVTKMTVKGTKGEKVFNKESCRGVFPNHTISQAFTVTPVGENTVIYTTGGIVERKNMYILSAEGLSRSILDSVAFLDKSGVHSMPETNYTKFVFEGRGYGHLVGMSQNGANGMAKQGYDYIEILTHYYQGTEID
ncbi:MAG: SpoIID/LytB domain-containing protein [Clostridia bacterium]|nr:SpoIID/LytB domain-containing protein [Clostridia bacterium]